jgi:dynein assembly factor 1, axonemal
MAGTEMTPELLKKLCKENGLYGTPHINDKMYLHYKGFKSIKSLEEYTGLRALWLEGNGFSKIEGLQNQKILKTLFLQENIIEKIEGLDNQLELDALNLSKNFIKRVENLSHMKKLTSLNLSHNQLSTAEDIAHILELESLQTIDIQHNKINDVNIVDILSKVNDLRVLYLMGNPVVKNIRHYRKTLIAKCKALKYLDDRPVFDDERRRVEAWMKVFEETSNLDAANEAERLEIQTIRKEKEELDERNFRAFEDLMRQGKEIRRQREEAAAAAAATGNAIGTVAIPTNDDKRNPFSGEKIIDVPESDIVKNARDMRWGESSVPFSERFERSKGNELSSEHVSPPPPPPPVNGQACQTIHREPEESRPKPQWVKLQIEEIDSDVTSDAENKRPTFSSLLDEATAEVAKDLKVMNTSITRTCAGSDSRTEAVCSGMEDLD